MHKLGQKNRNQKEAAAVAAPTEFTYYEPHIHLTRNTYSDVQLSKKQKFDVISNPEKINFFKNYLIKYSQDTLSPIEPFNIHDILEIPPKSCIALGDYRRISNLIREHYIENIETRPYFHFKYSHVGYAGINGDNNIFFLYDKTLRYSNFYGFENKSAHLPGAALNKIHLLPKDDYLLYVVIKLDKFMAEVVQKEYPMYHHEIKFSTQTCHSRKMDNEPLLRSLEFNGGVTQNIVIYGSSDPEIMSFILKGILELFKGQEDLLGDMDLNSPLDIPAFNIRLNPLVAYAAGNRTGTLDTMIQIRNNPRKSPTESFEIPEWLKRKQRYCSIEQDEINTDTRVLLGINVCRDNAPIDLPTECMLARINPKSKKFENSKFCFLQQRGNPILDPFPLYEDYKRRKAAIKAKMPPVESYNNFHPLGGFRRKHTRARRRKGRKSRRSRK